MRRQSTGILTLALVGGYMLYRNRYAIQKYFESMGIKTPMDTSSIGNAVRSGVAKLTGSTEFGVRSVKEDVKKAA